MPSFNDERVPQEAAQGAASLQLIDGLGAFDEAGLDAFVRAIRLAECGLSYAVVAIMGPQSSGTVLLRISLVVMYITSFGDQVLCGPLIRTVSELPFLNVKVSCSSSPL